jgi:hypothetical protein
MRHYVTVGVALALASMLAVPRMAQAQTAGTLNAGGDDGSYTSPQPVTPRAPTSGRTWYLFDPPSQSCETAGQSPKDEYDALDQGGSGPTLTRIHKGGELSQVEIQWPDTTDSGLVNVVEFFTSDGYCEAYRRQQLHQNDDLK